MMKIRSATRSDFGEISRIQIDSWRDAYSDVLPAPFLNRHLSRELTAHWRNIEVRDQDLVLVAEEGATIGFIAVWCRPVAFIDNLHVRPPQRSKKVGSALMRAAADRLVDRGHKTAYLWVFESNEKAIRFYARLGGIQRELSVLNIFGYNMPCRKIEWPDLSVLCPRRQSSS